MLYNLNQNLTQDKLHKDSTPWKTFVFTITIFVITILFYLGLTFGYKPYLQASINRSNKEIEELDRRAPEIGLYNKFIQFYSQLVSIDSLFRSRTSMLSFFDAFESATKDQVGFSDMKINIRDRVATLEGFADDFSVLAGQMILYENINNIDKLALLSARLFEDLVRFDLRIVFSEHFFKLNLAPDFIEEDFTEPSIIQNI